MVGNGTLILGFVWQTFLIYRSFGNGKQAFSSEIVGRTLQRDHIIEVDSNQFDKLTEILVVRC